ncbi:helix-turn-helix transcriptional regulator [bacterium SCSIO 12643]|nr:helix-turn-helix transcriptional regulator [bacterium SCSIO 12643]
MEKSEQILRLAKRIRSLRIQKGYTSYESFALEKGIHRAQYGRYETGTDIQFTSLVKIAQSFGMTLEEFFSEGFEDLNEN